MRNHLRWLRQQIEKAEQDLEEAQQRLKTWTDALSYAEKERDEKRTKPDPPPTEPQSKRRVGILGLAKKALPEHGAMSSSQLQKYLEQHGSSTTINSINTSLNRYKGVRFERDDDGDWYLVNEEGEDDDQDNNEDNEEEDYDDKVESDPF